MSKTKKIHRKMDHFQSVRDYSVEFISPQEIQKELRTLEWGLGYNQNDEKKSKTALPLSQLQSSAPLLASGPRLTGARGKVIVGASIKKKYHNALSEKKQTYSDFLSQRPPSDKPHYLESLQYSSFADAYAIQFYYTLEYLALIGAIRITERESNGLPNHFIISAPANKSELYLLDFMLLRKKPGDNGYRPLREKEKVHKLFEELKWYKKNSDGSYKYPDPNSFTEAMSEYVRDTSAKEGKKIARAYPYFHEEYKELLRRTNSDRMLDIQGVPWDQLDQGEL